MGQGSGAGLISVGNAGGKVLLTYSGTPSAPYSTIANLFEAKGFRYWTFQATDPVGSAQFVATAEIDGTIDPNTASGALNRWFKVGDISQEGTSLNYNGPLVAVRVSVTAYTSGTLVILGFATP